MKLQKAHYIVSTEGTADHAFFERTADYPQRTGGRLPAVYGGLSGIIFRMEPAVAQLCDSSVENIRGGVDAGLR